MAEAKPGLRGLLGKFDVPRGTPLILTPLEHKLRECYAVEVADSAATWEARWDIQEGGKNLYGIYLLYLHNPENLTIIEQMYSQQSFKKKERERNVGVIIISGAPQIRKRVQFMTTGNTQSLYPNQWEEELENFLHDLDPSKPPALVGSFDADPDENKKTLAQLREHIKPFCEVHTVAGYDAFKEQAHELRADRSFFYKVYVAYLRTFQDVANISELYHNERMKARRNDHDACFVVTADSPEIRRYAQTNERIGEAMSLKEMGDFLHFWTTNFLPHIRRQTPGIPPSAESGVFDEGIDITDILKFDDFKKFREVLDERLKKKP